MPRFISSSFHDADAANAASTAASRSSGLYAAMTASAAAICSAEYISTPGNICSRVWTMRARSSRRSVLISLGDGKHLNRWAALVMANASPDPACSTPATLPDSSDGKPDLLPGWPDHGGGIEMLYDECCKHSVAEVFTPFELHQRVSTSTSARNLVRQSASAAPTLTAAPMNLPTAPSSAPCSALPAACAMSS